ncbi:MAG TPA: hypothetical protein VLC95_16425, partial [Anaerolineae bacterium]|nr:hypothetical protein [Anaerolineae bacterium]
QSPLPDRNLGPDAPAPEAEVNAKEIQVVDAAQMLVFPANWDDINVANDPYWWTTGDSVEGVRTPGLDSIAGVWYELQIGANSLSGTARVDLDLLINGTWVGSFSVLPGEMSKSVSFLFDPISGPVYTIRLQETNTVGPGGGSITIPVDTSFITFYGPTASWFPATGDTTSVFADPYWYNAGDYAEGTRTPGLDSVTGVRYDLIIEDNALNTTGHIDLDLSINGVVVGSFTVLPGEMSKTVAFFFPPLNGPVYTIRLEETNTVDPGAGSAAILLDTSFITFLDAASFFPATGDVVNTVANPYWYVAGDYAEGMRTLGLDAITGVRYDLTITNNALNTTGHVDLDLSINGTLVGSFTVLPGEMTRSVIFFFPPISGPVYTIRLEETNTVDPGAGSVLIPLDTSLITFYAPVTSAFPATGDTVSVVGDPYWYNAGDYAEGTRMPGLDHVTGVRYNLILGNNALNNTAQVDLDLSINGVVVGSFSLLPGELSKSVAFFFPPISGPVYTVRLEETNTVAGGFGSVAIPLDVSLITFYDSTLSSFLPAAGDVISVQNDPYWWHVGDYAEGTRFSRFRSVTSVQYDLILGQNTLNSTGHVDLDLSINGFVVGSFSVLPGEMSKSGSFTFSPISGPTYVIRLEETNLVDPGAGSIVIPLDRSPMQFTTSVFLPLVTR